MFREICSTLKNINFTFNKKVDTKNKCRECMEEQFLHCTDNPCNYRIQKSLAVRSKYSTRNTCRPSNTTNINDLINLEKSTVDSLLSSNRISVLNSLLSKNIDINRLSIDNDLLLNWACREGYRDLVELLLSNGADPNIYIENHKLVLKCAILGDCTHIIDMLIEYGYNLYDELKSKGLSDRKYLHFATIMNKPKIIKHLLHYGLDPNSDDGLLNTCFIMEADILKLLLMHGTSLENMTEKSVTLASRIINPKSNWSHLVRNEILESRINRLQVLLDCVGVERCENYEYINSYRSLLHIAAGEKDTTCLEYLLKLGLDPDSRELSTGKTPLHIAAESKNTRTRTLLSYGSQTGIKDFEGNTALHIVVENFKRKDVRNLLLFGARSDIVNLNGKTAIDVALDNNDEKSIEWMLIFGAEFYEIERFANTYKKCYMIKIVLEDYKIKKRIVKMVKDLDAVKNKKLSLSEKKCKYELDKLKKLKIPDSEINCLDLLHLDRSELAKIASKWPTSEMTKFFNKYVRSNFPIYGNWLWKNGNIGIIYGPVYKRSVDSLDDIVDSKLPMSVIENVMSYLNYADMKNLIKVYQQRRRTF